MIPALLRVNLWDEYLAGIVASVFCTDADVDNSCEVSLDYFQHVLRILDERKDDPKMANAIQACIDKLNAAQAEGRHSAWVSGAIRRLKVETLITVGHGIVSDIQWRMAQRDRAASRRRTRRDAESESMVQKWDVEKAAGGQGPICGF